MHKNAKKKKRIAYFCFKKVETYLLEQNEFRCRLKEKNFWCQKKHVQYEHTLYNCGFDIVGHLLLKFTNYFGKIFFFLDFFSVIMLHKIFFSVHKTNLKNISKKLIRLPIFSCIVFRHWPSSSSTYRISAEISMLSDVSQKTHILRHIITNIMRLFQNGGTGVLIFHYF